MFGSHLAQAKRSRVDTRLGPHSASQSSGERSAAPAPVHSLHGHNINRRRRSSLRSHRTHETRCLGQRPVPPSAPICPADSRPSGTAQPHACLVLCDDGGEGGAVRAKAGPRCRPGNPGLTSHHPHAWQGLFSENLLEGLLQCMGMLQAWHDRSPGGHRPGSSTVCHPKFVLWP